LADFRASAAAVVGEEADECVDSRHFGMAANEASFLDGTDQSRVRQRLQMKRERWCRQFELFEDDNVLVGEVARENSVAMPERVVDCVKRSIGDPSWRFSVGDRAYSAVEISALILQKLKREAEKYLGQPVTEAVITVPPGSASFTPAMVRSARPPSCRWARWAR